jgi:methylmalonyl-CoA epimerase
MRVSDVHHIGHAVADLDAAIETYERLLGARCEHRETVPDQGVEAASMLLGGDRIELLSPLGADTPVGRFLAKRGPGVHHVAYEVDDIEQALSDAAAAGAALIDESPRNGLFGLRVAFIHPESVDGVLVELVQRMNGADRG